MSPNKDESAVHCFDPALSVLIMSGVSKHLSRSISLTVSSLLVIKVTIILILNKNVCLLYKRYLLYHKNLSLHME